MPEHSKKNQKTRIEGVTNNGKTFRPSDWAERMSGALATFEDRRIRYSPLLRPSMQDGHHCVLLDHALKESHPDLYLDIISFAEKNNLKICKDS